MKFEFDACVILLLHKIEILAILIKLIDILKNFIGVSQRHITGNPTDTYSFAILNIIFLSSPPKLLTTYQNVVDIHYKLYTSGNLFIFVGFNYVLSK